MMQTPRDHSHHPMRWWLAWLAWDGAGIALAMSQSGPVTPSALLDRYGLVPVSAWLAGSIILLALAMTATVKAQRDTGHARE